ncbi:hypothetical protein FF100_35510 [Methylobacterium terricola]|uniref:Uncharacterized protein n=1 Tax=Methylobacterium terricola TaxID=2583531 RepID=A0A5C4L4T8_9HYPH|nr:hypothetical protein [Methylobacterium terricola]TNC05514.1 hypothetical protein FF100_35510 [Methylobacterium terricola]
MIDAADRWGPFSPGIDAPERIARCRCLEAVIHLATGPRGQEAVRLLREAERDPSGLPAARAINAMQTPDKRHVWASYAALNKPHPAA